MEGRLQFRHDNTLYKNKEEIDTLIKKSVNSRKERYALYAEPIIFKYGDETNPNIVLAIGNYGDGENYNYYNNYFLIDIKDIENHISDIQDYLKDNNNNTNIVEIKEAISNISDSVNKNKTDIANLVTKDTELDKKIDDSVTNLTKKISDTSDSLSKEISTASGNLSDKIDETSDELHKRIYEEISGITLTYNRTEQTITLKSKSGQLLGYFGVQDFIKDGMIKSVVLTEDKKNIVIVWNDGSVVTIPLNSLIDVYTVETDSKKYLRINENKEISVVIGNESDYNGLATYTQLHDLSDVVGNGFKDTTITSKVNLLENRLITITEISDKTVEDALKLADKVYQNSNDIDSLEDRADKDEAKIDSNYSAITALTEEVKDAGKIDDVKVNGTSVVTDKIANIDLSGITGKYETDLDGDITTMDDIGGIPKGTKVSELTGKTLSDIITDILFPEIYPAVATKPNVVMSYSSEVDGSVYSIGSEITLSKVTASITGGKFNTPQGYDFKQPNADFETGTTFTHLINEGFEGYSPTDSNTGITSGTAKIKAGKNTVYYTVNLTYTAPSNYPQTSRGKDTTQTGKTDTSNSATWTDSAVTVTNTINVYGMYPCYTNVSGGTFISNPTVEVFPNIKDTKTIEIYNVPSEVDESEDYAKTTIEFPIGLTPVTIKSQDGEDDDPKDASDAFSEDGETTIHEIDGIKYEYKRMSTDHNQNKFFKYIITFNNNLY